MYSKLIYFNIMSLPFSPKKKKKRKKKIVIGASNIEVIYPKKILVILYGKKKNAQCTHLKNKEPMPKRGSCLFALLEDLFIYDDMLKIMSPSSH